MKNNECVIATTRKRSAMNGLASWVLNLDETDRALFTFTEIDGKHTLFMAPSGSEKGSDAAKHGEALRDEMISIIERFNYTDGSNPFDWVEVGFGESGQRVIRGNCEPLP